MALLVIVLLAQESCSWPKKRAVVSLLAGARSQAAVAGQVDTAECTVFPRRPMDGLRLE